VSQELFLIDSNSLITPHQTYYPFDFAHSFWEQMERSIKDGSVAILDVVKKELQNGNDSLKRWAEQLEIGCYIDHREENIVSQYSLVLQSVADNPCYKETALHEWSKEGAADPWIIAAAAAIGFTIITFEKPNGGLSPMQKSKVAKIPDVAASFDVKTESLYYMMRVLSFRL